ncbi:MAG: hypothetical protein JWN51_3122 [Phycisphaerales bacterium]|nr:hypothetical protein [Phycisphaerales bacterium]
MPLDELSLRPEWQLIPILRFNQRLAHWRLVHDPLAFRAPDSRVPALGIFQRSHIPAEREFIAIAVHVFLTDVVERAVNATLAQGEVAFGGVRVLPILAHVLNAPSGGAIAYCVSRGPNLFEPNRLAASLARRVSRPRKKNTPQAGRLNKCSARPGFLGARRNK